MKNLFKHTSFLAIIASLLWSSAFVGVKIGLKYHSPMQFAGVRFLLAGLLLLPFLGNWPYVWNEVKSNLRFIAIVAFLQVVLQYTFFYTGVNLVPASISAMIVGSSPLFVAAIAHFSIKTDQLSWIKAASILLGIIGVAIITLGRKSLPSGAEIAVWGVVFLILNNVSSGISNVVISKKKTSIAPMVLTSSSLILGGLGLIVISIPFEGRPKYSFPVEYFVALAWLSLISSVAVSIWNTLLQRKDVKVSELNIWKFLIPVSGAMLSWLILPGESPDLTSITGMSLIGISLIVLSFSKSKF